MTVGSKPENGEPNNAAKSDHIGQNAQSHYFKSGRARDLLHENRPGPSRRQR